MKTGMGAMWAWLMQLFGIGGAMSFAAGDGVVKRERPVRAPRTAEQVQRHAARMKKRYERWGKGWSGWHPVLYACDRSTWHGDVDRCFLGMKNCPF